MRRDEIPSVPIVELLGVQSRFKGWTACTTNCPCKHQLGVQKGVDPTILKECTIHNLTRKSSFPNGQFYYTFIWSLNRDLKSSARFSQTSTLIIINHICLGTMHVSKLNEMICISFLTRYVDAVAEFLDSVTWPGMFIVSDSLNSARRWLK